MTRDALAAALRAAVDVPWMDAAWVGGSEAFGRHDAWSDLDVQLLCDPGRADEAIALVERCLETHGGIAHVWPLETESYRQRFYQPRALPEWCMVDLCVMKPERLAPFLDPVRHGRPVVWFDRVGALRPVDDPSLAPVFAQRLAAVRGRVTLLGHLPTKALARGHLLEAADAYQRHLVAPLVELLRARYCPRRQDYGVRYLDVDLPPEVVARLERLALPGSPAALQAAIDEVRAWLAEELRASAPDGARDEPQSGPSATSS